MGNELEILLNAFRPGTEADEPALFAGREEQIKDLAEALHTDGVAPVIFGDRGLGKSSLALQARRIAMGDLELLSEHGLAKWGFGSDESYIAFYVPCTGETRDTSAVVQRLVNSVASASLLNGNTDRDQFVDRTTTHRVSLKLFEREVSSRYEARATNEARRVLGVEEQLLDLTTALTEETGHRVLLIIDELDRLQQTTGLASLIKTSSNKSLKFMLVGLAQNVGGLLEDHRSLERVTVPVGVPLMEDDELSAIIDRALEHLDQHEFGFEFEPRVRARIAELASGFPWFVHLLGQAALMDAYERGDRLVLDEHLGHALRDLTLNRFAQQFADLYQVAVRDSPLRETVLRTFAQWRGRDIPTGAVYPILKERLGVANPSVYRGQLAAELYGRVLLIPPFQDRRMIRFANEMFKIYVRLRDTIFAGVGQRVDGAWTAARGPGL